MLCRISWEILAPIISCIEVNALQELGTSEQVHLKNETDKVPKLLRGTPHTKGGSMYYHLKEHIYVTQFKDELIMLDTLEDTYTICSDQVSGILNHLFKSGPVLPRLNELNHTQVQWLSEQNIVEEKEAPYPFFIDDKANSNGVSNVNWSLPLDSEAIKINLDVIKALYALVKINTTMKLKGFDRALRLIKTAKKSRTTYIVPKPEELDNLANIVNKACYLYPTRTKCLEWAMTFVLLALNKGWKCNLEIGVQNYPFYAHAWVECYGTIVMDDQSLRHGLAVILNEPFRKEIR